MLLKLIIIIIIIIIIITKHGNLTKVQNENLCRWKWTF